MWGHTGETSGNTLVRAISGIRCAVIVLSAAVFMCLAASPAIAATCSTEDQAAVASANRSLAKLKARQSASAQRFELEYKIAQARCGASARYVAAAGRSLVATVDPQPGQRTSFYGVRLQWRFDPSRPDKQRWWYFDVETTLKAWSAAPTAARKDSVIRHLVRMSRPAGPGLLITRSPVRSHINLDQTIRTAAYLSSGSTPVARSVTARILRAFSTQLVTNTVKATPLLTAIPQATSLTYTKRRVVETRARSAVETVRYLTRARIRFADTGAWSKIGGTYSTADQHTALVRRSAALAAAQSDAVLADRVAKLRSYLTRVPDVRYTKIPVRSFYPWPRDGVRDDVKFGVSVDKPSTLQFTVYSTTGDVVFRRTKDVLPGVWEGKWTGHTNVVQPAVLAKPGTYLYGLRIRDRAGNLKIVPGLGTMTIARDSTPPKIEYGSVTYKTGISPRKFTVRWTIHEPLSPKLKVKVSIRKVGVRRAMYFATSDHSGSTTVSTQLGSGTYRAFLTVYDGSKNVSSRVVGYVTIP